MRTDRPIVRRRRGGRRAVAGSRRAKPLGQRRSAGFTLLESIVALTVFAASGMALYALFNTNLITLNRTADVSRQVAVVRNAMDYLSAVNPHVTPEGDVELGGVDVAWRSKLVEPVRQGQNTIGGRGDFDLGLYEVEFEVAADGRSLGTWRMRVAGYEKVRGIFPGQEF